MENIPKDVLDKTINDLTEQFGDALTDERKMSMAILKLSKKYNTKNNKNNKEEKSMAKPKKDDSKDLIELEVPESIGDEKPRKSVDSDWGRFLSTIPPPSESEVEYEKTPSFEIELGATYHFRLTDPSKAPYSHEMDGKWGPYVKHAVKVTLLGVNDEDLLEKVFDYGDEKGELAYTIGRNYTLWITQNSMEYMAVFWSQVTDDGLPDNRAFTYKHTKKGKKNLFIYGESKLE